MEQRTKRGIAKIEMYDCILLGKRDLGVLAREGENKNQDVLSSG